MQYGTEGASVRALEPRDARSTAAQSHMMLHKKAKYTRKLDSDIVHTHCGILRVKVEISIVKVQAVLN